MRLLLDTNVVLDLVLARMPWAAEAAALMTVMGVTSGKSNDPIADRRGDDADVTRSQAFAPATW